MVLGPTVRAIREAGAGDMGRQAPHAHYLPAKEQELTKLQWDRGPVFYSISPLSGGIR
jgi:hypothetical protein